MAQKSLFSRLKTGERIAVCSPDGEPFEIEWGPRGPDAHLVKHVGGRATRLAMSEAECHAWLATEEARGMAETAKAKAKKSPPKKAAKK